MRILTRSLRLSVLVFLAAAVGACGSNRADDDRLLVVATTNVIGDVVSDLVGDQGQVEVLMEAGVDPHAFSPSAAQVGLINRADLVVANGLLLEAGLHDSLVSAAEDGIIVLELAPELDPIAFAADHEGDHDHDDDDHAHGELDPHFFLDPVRMAQAVDVVAAALSEVEPDVPWESRAATVRADLEALHAEIEEILAVIPPERRKLVTDHDSLAYFADRYDFDVVATITMGTSTLAEPSASSLARLAQLLDEEGVRHIFVDTTAPTALAEAVAAELGGEASVHRIHTGSLGPPGSGADTYAGMMRTNAATIAEALGD